MDCNFEHYLSELLNKNKITFIDYDLLFIILSLSCKGLLHQLAYAVVKTHYNACGLQDASLFETADIIQMHTIFIITLSGIYSPLLRFSTARGSCTGLVTVGPT